MYKVGDKFDIREISDFFCEIIGMIPGGQSQKETIYIISFAGTKFNLPESVFDVLFYKKEAKRMELDLADLFKEDMEDPNYSEYFDPEEDPKEDSEEDSEESEQSETKIKRRGRPSTKDKEN